MNQTYAEAGAKRKDTGVTMLIRVLVIFGIVVGVMLTLTKGYLSIVGIILVVVLIFLFPKLSVEYEYVYVDGQIDFDRISGKSKRKTLLRIDMEQAEIVAMEGSHALDSYTYVQLEKKDFSSGDKSQKPYIIIANIDQKKCRVVFNPSEKMLTMMKQKSPRKVVLE